MITFMDMKLQVKLLSRTCVVKFRNLKKKNKKSFIQYKIIGLWHFQSFHMLKSFDKIKLYIYCIHETRTYSANLFVFRWVFSLFLLTWLLNVARQFGLLLSTKCMLLSSPENIRFLLNQNCIIFQKNFERNKAYGIKIKIY